MPLKQVILVRDDLKLPKGKLASQVAHASVECVLKAPSMLIKKWRSEGMKKIVLKAPGVEDLYRYKQLAENEGITVALITDAGMTVVEPGTTTCLGIGPDSEEKIDRITGHLKMM